MLLVETLLDGDQLDDAARFLVEGCAFGNGGVGEGDEEATLAVLARHHGLK